MEKRVKTTDADIRINTTTIEVVKISGIRFEHDEELPCVQVYADDDSSDTLDFLDEIEETEDDPIVGFEDLKRVALNWYFNNVEIVKEINKEECKNESNRHSKKSR